MLEINKIYQGDCLEVLKTFPDDFIDCVITSPPYWAVRDYEIDNQIGLEEHPQMYIDKIVEVMRECKRVLKPTGTIFLNLGDSFYTKSGSGQGSNYLKHHEEMDGGRGELHKAHTQTRGKFKSNWLQNKQRLMIPARIAIKCQDDLGLVLRNDITWVKQMLNWKTKDSWGTSMPTSVQDRLNTNSEYIFFFVKSNDYFFDLDAIRVKHKDVSLKRNEYGRNAMKCKEVSFGRELKPGEFLNPKGKNPGDCIMFPLEPSSENHYAMFPKTLPEMFIKCGCPKEVCNKCGRPKQVTQVTQVTHNRINERDDNKVRPDNFERVPQDWKPKEVIDIKELTCDCNVGFSAGIVLDPFSGGGTTLFVAKHLLRNYIGIEINPKYIKEIQNNKLAQEVLI